MMAKHLIKNMSAHKVLPFYSWENEVLDKLGELRKVSFTNKYSINAFYVQTTGTDAVLPYGAFSYRDDR